MGIQGLIPFLNKATRPVNIRQYSGCCVAIDAYCWLHRGAYTCVEKLARGEPCYEYVHYCMKFVNMLLSHNIKPILVFDGQHLPAKAATEKKRREFREKSRKQAAELLRAGRTDEARNFLRRCIDVNHEMALALMKECRRRYIDCIVAPYEADAQLAYLNIKNIAQIVITEDSDLVLFGCTKILFKMDLAGNGLLVEQERLNLTMGIRPENFSFDKFRYMCILSGCDYLPSLPGIGLSKACKFITRTADPDIYRALSRMAGHLNMKTLTVTDEYREEFMLADATFRYQLVYDPFTRSMVHLTEPPNPDNVTEYAGKMLSKNVAFQLALGNLNPISMEKMDDFNPDAIIQPDKRMGSVSWSEVPLVQHASIWSSTYNTTEMQQHPVSRQVERPSTKGKVVNKERKVIIEKRKMKEHDGIANGISDTELTTIYVTSQEALEEKPPIQEPLNKRQRITSAVSNNMADNNSLSSVHKEMEIVQSESALNSPSTIIGKSNRNPFFKQQYESSKNAVESICPSGQFPTASDKYSALNKFKLGQQHTEIDEKVIVHSRFFSKRTQPTSKENTECEVRMRKFLKPVPNILKTNINCNYEGFKKRLTYSPQKQNLIQKNDLFTNSEKRVHCTMQDSDAVTPKKKCTGSSDVKNTLNASLKSNIQQSSFTKSFSWCQGLNFVKGKSVTGFDRSFAAKQEFRDPLNNICSLNSQDKSSECDKSSRSLQSSSRPQTEDGSIFICSRNPSRHINSSGVLAVNLDCKAKSSLSKSELSCVFSALKSSLKNLDSVNIPTSSSEIYSPTTPPPLTEKCTVPKYDHNTSINSSDSQVSGFANLSQNGNSNGAKNILSSSNISAADSSKISTPYVGLSSSSQVEQAGTIEIKNSISQNDLLTVGTVVNNVEHSTSLSLSASVSMEDGYNLDSDHIPTSSMDDLTLVTSPTTEFPEPSNKESTVVEEIVQCPKSDQINCLIALKTKSIMNAKSCRRLGLSKNIGKQQSLLSMFGFQRKPKLQHE